VVRSAAGRKKPLSHSFGINGHALVVKKTPPQDQQDKNLHHDRNRQFANQQFVEWFQVWGRDMLSLHVNNCASGKTSL